MKNFLKRLAVFGLALAMLGVSIPSFSQFVTRKAKDSASTSETRYITWSSTPDGVTGIQISVSKVSGTLAAAITLEARIDTVTTAWTQIADTTFTVTNVASQAFIFPILPQAGNGYRIKIVATGSTQKAYYYAAYLRRQ